MARKLGGRVSAGLLIEAAACLVLAVVFKLDAIASIGSAVALLIFTLITAAHFRVRSETGASAVVLTVAIVAAGGVLLTFVFTTLIHEPASMVTLGGRFRAQHRPRLRVETGPLRPDGPGSGRH